MIRTLVLDVDGVLTDGRKHYNQNGEVISKVFCDKDWTAIKRFRAIGINVVCITGDGFNAAILANRNIPVMVCRNERTHTDKSEYLQTIIDTYGGTPAEICMVGDDLFDIKLMQMVGYSFCPSDAPLAVKQCCRTLSCKGGENLLVVLFEYLEYLGVIPKVSWRQTIDMIYQLDVEEKF